MPKITHERVTRIHISLLQSKYDKIRLLAQENKTSISEILRTMIDLLIENEENKVFSQIKDEKKIEKIEDKHPIFKMDLTI